jgi:hypothetical protein
LRATSATQPESKGLQGRPEAHKSIAFRDSTETCGTAFNSASAIAAFVVQPVHFTSEGFSNSAFRLSFVGTTGSNYILEASTNFINWTPLSTNQATTNVFDVFDPQATNFPHRFYRILLQ